MHFRLILLFVAVLTEARLIQPIHYKYLDLRQDDTGDDPGSAPTTPSDTSAPTSAADDTSSPTSATDDTSAPTSTSDGSTPTDGTADTPAVSVISSSIPTASAVTNTGCTDPTIPTDPGTAATLYNNAGAAKIILDNLSQIGGVSGFPQLVVQGLTNPTFQLDCSSFDNPGACQVPRGPSGSICEAVFPENSDANVLIIRSYVNMYNFLRNSNLAAQVAHDLIAKSGFLDKLRSDITPGKDILAEVFLQLLEIAISFIPVGGIELLAVKTAVKVFKKIADKTIKSAIRDGNTADPPSLASLQAQLDMMLTTFQGAVVAQHKQIFVDANAGTGSDNPQFTWLDQGVQLSLTISQNDLQTNIQQSFQNFMLSSYMASFKAHIVRATAADVSRLHINCNKPTELSINGAVPPNIIALSGDCFCYGYPKTQIFQGFLEGQEPANTNTFNQFSNLYGPNITFPNIISNALSCQKSGGDISKVDITGFLNDPTSTVPNCLFGFPVVSVDNNHG